MVATFLVHAINIGLGLIAITFNVYLISAMCVGQAIGLLVSLLISYAVKRRKRRNNNPKKYELNRGSHQVTSRENIPGELFAGILNTRDALTRSTLAGLMTKIQSEF